MRCYVYRQNTRTCYLLRIQTQNLSTFWRRRRNLYGCVRSRFSCHLIQKEKKSLLPSFTECTLQSVPYRMFSGDSSTQLGVDITLKKKHLYDQWISQIFLMFTYKHNNDVQIKSTLNYNINVLEVHGSLLTDTILFKRDVEVDLQWQKCGVTAEARPLNSKNVEVTQFVTSKETIKH